MPDVTARPMTVLDLVARIAAEHPDLPAVRDADGTLTYRQLWRCSGRLARRLVRERPPGAGRQRVVGLCAARSADLVAGVLGILRSGAGYLPLDADYPRERLGWMIEHTGTSAVVGHADAMNRLPQGLWTGVVIDGLAASAAERGSRPGDDLPDVGPDDLGYVIFTSGSTGRPKGVVMHHRPLMNLVRWQAADSRSGIGDATVQFAPISFDVSFQEIFSTLSTGGVLVCIGDAERRDPVRLWRTLAEQRVSRLFLPFIALQSLALFADRLPRPAPPLREVITAGEQLQCDERLKRLFAALPGCRLVNQYGPSETHVVTRHTLPEQPRDWPLLPPIGVPVDGVSVRVVDAALEPVPRGEAGELCIGGVPLARGYWGDAEMTARRFPTAPDGTRLYRTGDLVRVDDEDRLQYLGRGDEQVKVNGYRIELAEVERALTGHPAVRAAAAAVRGTGAAGKTLAAFVVLDPGHDGAELTRFVAQQLPDYAVPSRIQVIEALPLTPSGKLDRRKLSEPDFGAGASGADEAAAGESGSGRSGLDESGPDQGSADEVASVVGEALRTVLGIDPATLEGFAVAGGDSIAAIRVSAHLAERLGVFVAADSILLARDAKEIAGLARKAEPASAPALQEHPDLADLTVSPGQRQFLLEELFAEAPQHVVAAELLVRGPFDQDAASRASRELVARHSALRCRFRFDGTDFRQSVLPSAEPAVEFRTAVDAKDLQGIRDRQLARPFDLDDALTPRVTVTEFEGCHHVLFVLHHVCCDGWTLDLLLEEFVELYSAAVEGRPDQLDPAPPQFHQYLVPEPHTGPSPSPDEHLAYWITRLADPPPPIRLAAERRRPEPGEPAVARLPVELSGRLLTQLRAAAATHDTTPFTVLTAAWAGFIGRRAGVDDLCVAIPVAGRGRPGSDRAAGLFLNTAVLRLATRGLPFTALVADTRQGLAELQAHRDTPFTDVVRCVLRSRDPDRHPLAQVMVTLQPGRDPRFRLPGGAVATVLMDLGAAEPTRLDLVLNLAERGSGLAGWLDYDTSLFDAAHARQVRKEFLGALRGALEEGDLPEVVPDD